jgi:hypothetical protein
MLHVDYAREQVASNGVADMRWFNFNGFRKRNPSMLPQICYDIAYFVLPHYVYTDLEKIVHICA